MSGVIVARKSAGSGRYALGGGGAPGGAGLVLGVSTAGLSGLATLGGAAVSGGDVLARATYPGDATLDGAVDTADLGVLLSNFGTLYDPASDPLWSSGDVNYDASVDTGDLGPMLDHFGQLADDPGAGAVTLDTLAGDEPPLSGTLAGDAAVATGEPYTLTLTATGPWAAVAESWAVDWGDGTDPQVVTADSSGATVVTHAFAPGVATPVVTATISSPGGAFDAGEPLEVAVTGVTAPGTPGAVTAAAHGRNRIDVSWTDAAGTARQFEVERSDDNGATWQHVTTVNRGTTTYADTGLTPSTTHRYRVVASNDAGTSAAGGGASPATTPSGLPTGLTAGTPPAGSGALPGDLWLSWGSAGADVTGYEVELRHDTDDGPDAGANFHLISTAPASAGGCLVTGLEPGQSYDLRARADYADGTASAYVARSATGPTTLTSAGDETLTPPTLTATDPPASFPVGAGFTVSQPSGQIADVVVDARWTDRPGFLAGAGFDVWQEVGGFTPATTAGTHAAELNPGWDYVLRGQARSADADHHTSPYATVTVTAQGTPVPVPTDVAAALASDGGVDVTWDDGSSGGDDAATGFTVRGGDLTGLTTGKHYVSQGAPAGTSGSVHFAPADLLPGSKYQFAVFAEGPSDVPNFTWLSLPALTAVVSTAPAPTTAPAAPAWVKAKADTHDPSDKPADNEVILTWANTPKDETGYKVYRLDPDADKDGAEDAPRAWTLVKTTGADVTTWTDKGMEPGDYKYLVVSYNAGGTSDPDPAVTPPPAQTTPPNLVGVGVWPKGYLVTFDGTWDYPDQYYRAKGASYIGGIGGDPKAWKGTAVFAFHSRFVGPRVYKDGVGAVTPAQQAKVSNGGKPPWLDGDLLNGAFGFDARSILRAAYEKAVRFYQDADNRKNVPLDITGYSRGAYCANALANLIASRGIPDLNSHATFGGFKYFSDKPMIRFLGLVSPVKQMGGDAAISLLTFGRARINLDWGRSYPSAARNVIEIVENDPNNVWFPQDVIKAGAGAGAPEVVTLDFGTNPDGSENPNPQHATIGSSTVALTRLLKKARSVNVPVAAFVPE